MELNLWSPICFHDVDRDNFSLLPLIFFPQVCYLNMLSFVRFIWNRWWIRGYGALVKWYRQVGNRSTTKRTCHSATLYTTSPTETSRCWNPTLRGGRPPTNCLSHSTAIMWKCTDSIGLILCFVLWFFGCLLVKVTSHLYIKLNGYFNIDFLGRTVISEIVFHGDYETCSAYYRYLTLLIWGIKVI
jgi:hypothetical protein